MQKINFRPFWLKYFQTIITVAIIVSFIIVIRQFWNEIHNLDWLFNPKYLLLSIILVIFTVLGWAAVWSWLFNRLNSKPFTLEQGISIYLYGNLAKYLPGSIWNYVTRGYLGYTLGFQPETIWVSSLIEIGVSISSGLIIYSLTQLFPHQNHPFLPVYVILLGLITLLGVISPPVLKFLLAWLQSKIKWGNKFQIDIDISWRDYLKYVGISIVTWILVGVAFCLFVTSIYPLPNNHALETIGVWSLSISLGMLAITIPQGIGVREGILVMTMGNLISLPAAISIAILSRFWIIFCEFIATLIWWSITKTFIQILPKNY